MPVNLSALDLNLMVVFNALMADRSVSKAGKRLGMSQSATSNALNRLRHMLKDPLFVRTVEGMQPTAKALELAGPVSEALHQFELALEPELFEPDTTNWTFNIAISDLASLILLPRLVPKLAATGVNVRFWTKINAQVPIQLASNAVDFVIGVYATPHKRIERTDLFEEDYVCVMRRGHPLAERFDADAFLSADHLSVRNSGDATNLFDNWLSARGLTRRVSMTIGQYLVAPEILRRSDLLLSIFQHSARMLCQDDSLIIRPLPFEFSRATVSLCWNAALTNLQSHKWLRRLIIETCREVKESSDSARLNSGYGSNLPATVLSA